MYARDHGRHAKLHFVPTEFRNGRVVNGTWVARFSLMSNDKRLLLYQQGRAEEPPTEDVWFHRPVRGAREGEMDCEPLDICQMGASGVRQFLERGNTWSGRGEFSSLEEQARKAIEANAEMRQKFKEEKKEESRRRMVDERRSRLKIPFVQAGKDLGGPNKTQGESP
jgi:hypothetical protein